MYKIFQLKAEDCQTGAEDCQTGSKQQQQQSPFNNSSRLPQSSGSYNHTHGASRDLNCGHVAKAAVPFLNTLPYFPLKRSISPYMY